MSGEDSSTSLAFSLALIHRQLPLAAEAPMEL